MKTKASYAIVSLVLLSGSVAAFGFWSARNARVAAVKKEAALKARDSAIDDYYSGKAFVARDGEKEALSDIAKGIPKFYVYGQERRDREICAQLMRERFGIEWKTIAGCMVSDPLVRFADSYNAEIRRFVADRFDAGAFEQAERDATAIWRAKNETANQMPEPTAGSVTPAANAPVAPPPAVAHR